MIHLRAGSVSTFLLPFTCTQQLGEAFLSYVREMCAHNVQEAFNGALKRQRAQLMGRE